jgi:hypothetical protein
MVTAPKPLRVSIDKVRKLYPGRCAPPVQRLLPVIVLTRASAAEAIADHGVVDVAALDVTSTKAGGGGDMRVGASCAMAEVETVDKSPSERQRYRVTGTVSGLAPVCRHWRLSRRARCDGESQARKSFAAEH